MSIVLSILQVIGWVLLILLLLLLVVLLVLLFCPLRYLIEGDWQEEKWARFKAHWLFHLLRAKISYGEDLLYGEINILWKKITFSHDFTKKEEEELDDALDDVLDDSLDFEDDIDSSEEVDEPQRKVIGTETAEELRNQVNVSEEENLTEEGLSEEDIEEKIDLQNDEILEESEDGIDSKIKGTIDYIKEIYSRIKVILANEENQEAVKHIKDELIYLIKFFLPKKSKVNAVFSTGSPDTTGQLFGVLALFPAMYNKNWDLMPDFQADGPYFKGTFWGKGWIAIYQFVGIVLRILFDKNCRKLYTRVNKFIKWMKNEDKPQEEK